MEILFRVVQFIRLMLIYIYIFELWHWKCCTTIKVQYGLSDSTNEDSILGLKKNESLL